MKNRVLTGWSFFVSLPKLFAFILGVWALAPSATLAGPEEGLFQAAKIIHDTAQQQDGELRLISLEQSKAILDQIVVDYPATDLAVRVLLEDTIEGLNVGALNAELESLEGLVGTSSSEASSATGEVLQGTIQAEAPIPTTAQPSRLPDGNEEDEGALELDRLAIRDLQARLLVLGHDPNGVDGAIGRGTRSAIRAWQATVQVAPNGFLNRPQYEELKQASESDLQEWLKVPENARRHTPPPPIALGPTSMTGNWQFQSRCGPNSRLPNQTVTGAMSIAHTGGGNYSGTMRNSQGFRAQMTVTLRGRTVQGNANFGLFLGRVSFTARVEDQRLAMNGTDSNGCRFFASK
jgi:peptidoglycan hydrolase-like protein with peptidoglycan-binding domain